VLEVLRRERWEKDDEKESKGEKKRFFEVLKNPLTSNAVISAFD